MASGQHMPDRRSASPPSPTASFYDVSDDEEGEYNTITHSSSGRGVKLLYSKSKVYVHPTPSAKDNIAGFIALVQQKVPPRSSTAARASASASSSSNAPQTPSSSPNQPTPESLLLAWLPEWSLGDAYSTYVKVDLSDDDSPPKQTYLVPPPPASSSSHGAALGTYAFAIPVSEIYSLLVRPPSIGWWFGSMIVNTRAGDSFPALFFHDSECQSTILQKKKRARESFDPFGEGGLFWGGDEVLRWLRRYVPVERSGADPSVYLVNASHEDRQGFSSPASEGFPDSQGASSSRGNSAADQLGLPSAAAPGVPPALRDAVMDPLTKALKEARWSFLEKLSQVTNFTRRTAQDVLENPKVPPQVRRLMRNPEVQTLQEEFDSARLYLARWALGVAEQSERDKSQRMWTARDVLEMEESTVGEFEILEYEAGQLSLAENRAKPVALKEWRGFFDRDTGQLLVTPDEVKERIFHGGLDAEDGVRQEAWLFLLGIYRWDSTAEERRAVVYSRRDEYLRLKGAWWEKLIDSGGEGEGGEWWREQRARIEKDVHRTDRNIALFAGEDTPHPNPDSPFSEVGTNVHLEQLKDMLLTYNEYNRDLGYVQGMSDLLAPIYAVLQDDALAFWGFVGFMERMERNFLRDQSGMRAQLQTLDQLVQLMDPKLYAHLQAAESTNFFFFFRMLLVWFKREFDWPDVLRLWETLWTDYLSSQFHLFIALAILEKHRDVIMDHLKHFDVILKYINELSSTIDLHSTLARAEVLFRRFRHIVDTVDKKDLLPATSIGRPRATAARSNSDVSAGRQQQQQQQQQQQPKLLRTSTDVARNGDAAAQEPSTPQQALSPAASAAAATTTTGADDPNAVPVTVSGSSSKNPRARGAAAGAAKNHAKDAAAKAESEEETSKNDKKRAITPELRQLLSREIVRAQHQHQHQHQHQGQVQVQPSQQPAVAEAAAAASSSGVPGPKTKAAANVK